MNTEEPLRPAGAINPEDDETDHDSDAENTHKQIMAWTS